VPADLFGESAGQRRYSQALPMWGDAGEVRGVPEEVRVRVNHFAGLWVTESFSVPCRESRVSQKL
jgi:hypothetical protein